MIWDILDLKSTLQLTNTTTSTRFFFWVGPPSDPMTQISLTKFPIDLQLLPLSYFCHHVSLIKSSFHSFPIDISKLHLYDNIISLMFDRYMVQISLAYPPGRLMALINSKLSHWKFPLNIASYFFRMILLPTRFLRSPYLL
jgi:hypothetical protein